jgi:hypothetical protein
VTGSEVEPTDPQYAADQMRTATDRLRDQAWMVAPLTTAPAAIEAEATQLSTSGD